MHPARPLVPLTGEQILTDDALVPSGQRFPTGAAVGVEPRTTDIGAENQKEFFLMSLCSAIGEVQHVSPWQESS